MSIKISSDSDGVMTAHLSGEIDHYSAQLLRTNIDIALNDNRPSRLILDFSGVTFMDSSGVGLVMGRYKFMKELGGTVELAGMPPFIEKVMSLARMDKLVNMSGQKGQSAASSIIDKGKEDKHG